MVGSLSQELNLTINDYQIILNQELNESELTTHSLEKAGFFARLAIESKRNELVFWSKNCGLKYLKEDFENAIYPSLDTSAGAAYMHGTSSYLWYKKNKLSKFRFQIIQNKMAAQFHLDRFEKKLIDSIGKPWSDGSFTIWEIENQMLILEYPKNRHGYIHLMFS